MPAQTTPNGPNPGIQLCDAFDFNASLLNATLVDWNVVSNGSVQLETTSGATLSRSIPFVPDFVVSGLDIALSTSPSANVLNYTNGTYQINAQPYAISVGGSITLVNGDISLPRVDIVYVTTSNTIVYQVGTPNANPVEPTAPPNTLVVAVIGVDANANNLGGYTLLAVNVNTRLSPGLNNNDTLRWNSVQQRWVRSNALRVSDFNVTIPFGYFTPVANVTNSFGLGTGSYMFLANASSGPIVVTLPVNPPNGQRLFVKKADNSLNTVTFNLNGRLLEGAAAAPTLSAQWESIHIVYNSTLTQWIRINTL